MMFVVCPSSFSQKIHILITRPNKVTICDLYFGDLLYKRSPIEAVVACGPSALVGTPGRTIQGGATYSD